MALFNYECDEVKHIIDEVSPNYPQLTTYEKEWLFFHKYHYIPGIPVDLEYETVSVNPTGMVSNAIPYQYKSAILKGNTMVNLVTNVASNDVGNYNSSPCIIKLMRNLTTETLTIIFNVTTLEMPDGSDGIMRIGGGWSGTIRHKPTVGINKVLYNNTQQSNNWLGVFSNSSSYEAGQRISISDVIVLEGEQTQEDIPYFEGMKSVKMPVLQTTGKNIFPTNNFIECGTDNRMIGQYVYEVYLKSGNYRSSFVHADDSDKDTMLRYEMLDEQDNQVLVLGAVDRRFTIENDGVYKLKFSRGSAYYNTYTKIQVQIEEGSTPSSYESYKSNILTVNEDVTLRSNGSVYDELDLLTGKLTQRIDENGEVLSQEIVKTVDLTPLNNPYEGTNHYELTSNILCEAILEVPVVSTGKQTLEEIND